MNVTEYKAIQINKIIKESEVFKTYAHLKTSISKKYELQEVEIKELQQELVNLAYTDDENFTLKKAEYISKKDEFYQDPLIKRFIDAYCELQKMISGVKNIIESGV